MLSAGRPGIGRPGMGFTRSDDAYDLAAGTRNAFLDEFASGKELHEATGDTGPKTSAASRGR